MEFSKKISKEEGGLDITKETLLSWHAGLFRL